MDALLESVVEEAKKEIAELEDERLLLLLGLMDAGMSEKDASTAVELHMRITAPKPAMRLKPIFSIGSDKPVDWIPTRAD